MRQLLEEVQALRRDVAAGFGYVSRRLDEQDKALGIEKTSREALEIEVRPIVAARSTARKLGFAALLACASVAGGGLAAYALSHLGLGNAHVELTPPETP
jgi:hypothetical protein